MGLGIIRDTEYGTTAAYWVVAKTNIDWVNKKASIRVDGYKDLPTRNDLKSPMVRLSFNFEEIVGLDGKIIDPFPFSPENNIVAKAYELIKTMPDFSGAIDL